MSTQGKLPVSVQGTLAPEHVSTQGTLAREHVSTQDTLTREHLSTLAREHVFSTRGTQFSRLKIYTCLINRSVNSNCNTAITAKKDCFHQMIALK